MTISDTEWIAARQALSLAHRELNQAVLDTPYDVLPEPLRTRRVAYDRALAYSSALQRERQIRAGAMIDLAAAAGEPGPVE